MGNLHLRLGVWGVGLLPSMASLKGLRKSYWDFEVDLQVVKVSGLGASGVNLYHYVLVAIVLCSRKVHKQLH